MTTTERHEAPLVEAALHHEGTEGYIAERLGKIALINERKNEIHQQIAVLNRELGQLQNDAWGLQCDVVRARQDGRQVQSA